MKVSKAPVSQHNICVFQSTAKLQPSNSLEFKVSQSICGQVCAKFTEFGRSRGRSQFSCSLRLSVLPCLLLRMGMDSCSTPCKVHSFRTSVDQTKSHLQPRDGFFLGWCARRKGLCLVYHPEHNYCFVLKWCLSAVCCIGVLFSLGNKNPALGYKYKDVELLYQALNSDVFVPSI